MQKQEKTFFRRTIFLIKNHIENNIKEYFIISIIFLIGIVLGTFFINSMEEVQKNQIINYINEFVSSLKGDYKIDNNLLISKILISNFILVFLLWLISLVTIFGILIICLFVFFRGFLFGFTISSIILTFEIGKGILFSICSLLFQNIFYIPCIIAIGVSSIKFYKAIVNNKKKGNIKIEFIKHSIFCLIIGGILVLSSFVEAFASVNLLNIFVKYI